MASPAGVSIRVYTETDATTESAAVTGIDLISADNATNSTANRATYPITAGTQSYEKWLKAYVDTAADNYVNAFKVWGTIAVQATTTLFVATIATGATPTNADSAVATQDWTNYTATNDALDWHSTNMTAIGSKTVYLVFQLDTGATAAAGNWTQQVISYSYDEA